MYTNKHLREVRYCLFAAITIIRTRTAEREGSGANCFVCRHVISPNMIVLSIIAAISDYRLVKLIKSRDE